MSGISAILLINLSSMSVIL